MTTNTHALFVLAIIAVGGVVSVVSVVSVMLARKLARRRRAKEAKKARPLYEMTSWSNADIEVVVHHASDERLCRIWRLTGVKLRTDHFPSTIGTIAEIRRLALDELAERDPDGFARWLAGQPHTTDPRTYLKS